jgi:hypothetical protein
VHTLVLGTTGSGKTSYCRWLAAALRKNRHHVVVFNPRMQPGWECDFESPNIAEVKKYCQQPFKKAVFLEEASYLNRSAEWDYFTTYARNDGCSCWIIAQKLKMLSPNLRDNCEEVVLFRSTFSDTRELADEFRERSLADVEKFEKGQFFVISGDAPMRESKLDWTKKTWATPRIVNPST